ncbi:MAG: RNA polymerase sigma factor, partial [Solirubrobacteraceae bacterium]
MARVRIGDEAAFEAIYDRYADGVFAFCAHMLRSREAAEDALQLTFVAVYRGLRNGDGCVSLRPWLYTIARNRCLTELRMRRPVVDADVGLAERPGADGPPEQFQRREQLRELLDDIQRLPVDQRAALVLFELGDQSHADIAIVLGVRREKVKALIFQAREGLMRGRRARNSSCEEVREQLATVRGGILPRSVTRAHIERCAACAAFEAEVHRQRTALALIVPAFAATRLKGHVLAMALKGGAVAAAAASGSGGAAAGGAGVAGGATATGGVTAAGGVTATGGVTAAGGVTATGGVTAAGGATAATGALGAGASAAGGTGARAERAGRRRCTTRRRDTSGRRHATRRRDASGRRHTPGNAGAAGGRAPAPARGGCGDSSALQRQRQHVAFQPGGRKRRHDECQ